jgi:hypothetical protein
MSTEGSSEPTKLVKMSASETLQGSADTVQINADLSPPPPGDEQWWWMQQVKARMRIVGASGGRNRFAIVVQVPRGDLELAGRQLRDALVEAIAAYPTSYPSAQRARDEQVAADEHARRQQQAMDQEVLNTVMGEPLGTAS